MQSRTVHFTIEKEENDMRRRGVLLTLLLAVCTAPAFAGGTAWSYKHGQELKWLRLTGSGGVLAGSDSSVVCLDPETGKTMWKREDLQGINSHQAEEVEGTPFLVVSKNNFTSTKVTVVNLETGKTEWETEKIKGATIGVFPVYEKDMLLLFTSHATTEAKTKPAMYAFQLSTGQPLWEGEFAEKVDLHFTENKSRFIQHYDLSGHMDPVTEGDAIYFTYAGLHKYDLKTGAMVWAVPYDVTEGKLKRANAQAAIDGDVIYTSAKGQLRAVDKANGAVKWTSPDYGAAVAEMAAKNDVIYGRMGGEFFDDKDRQWKLKKPLGVVAVDKSNGQMIWKYDGADDGITNMVFVDDGKTLVIADAKNIIGLDTGAAGKVSEAYKLKVEFNQHSSGGKKAMKVARFGFGGLKGGMKGMQQDKKNEDRPVAIYHAEKGYAVVRGRQNIVAFDPASRKVVWATTYAPPGVSNFEMIAMAGVYAFSYMEATSRAANSYAGTWGNTTANNDRQNALLGFSKTLSKRFSATKATDYNAYMLTNVEDGKDKGPGIVGVNMETGESFSEVLLKQKDPDYVVDEVAGRLFNRKDDTIDAYTLR